MNIATVMGGFALVTWVIFLGIFALVMVRASRNTPMRNGGLIVIIALAFAIIFSSVSSGVVFINASERGVVISAVSPKGYRDTALDPGLHWIVPFLESVQPYSVAKQTYTMSSTPNEGAIAGNDSITALTSDGQEVNVDASVIFAIDAAKVIPLHLSWQDRYTDDLIRPMARGIIRDAFSQYTVEQVYSSKRAELTSVISDQLSKKLGDNGLMMDSFILRNVTFSKEFSASIESKQIADQQAQQAKFVVEQRKQEAEQARQVAQGRADAVVIAAKGDAESRLISADAESKSLKLIADALRGNPDLLNYQYITKLGPSIQTMLLPSNAPFLLPLPNGTTTTSSPAAQPTAQPQPAAQPAAQPTPTATPTK
jgi:regulator of protease activity HflC (stomatin/prohibitin superfamily)